MPFLNETQPEIWDELESRPELSASRGGFLLLLVSGPYFFVNEMLQVYFFLHCYINWTIITIFKTDFSCCDSRKPTPMCDAWSGPVYTLLSQRLLLQSNSDYHLPTSQCRHCVPPFPCNTAMYVMQCNRRRKRENVSHIKDVSDDLHFITAQPTHRPKKDSCRTAKAVWENLLKVTMTGTAGRRRRVAKTIANSNSQNMSAFIRRSSVFKAELWFLSHRVTSLHSIITVNTALLWEIV